MHFMTPPDGEPPERGNWKNNPYANIAKKKAKSQRPPFATTYKQEKTEVMTTQKATCKASAKAATTKSHKAKGETNESRF